MRKLAFLAIVIASSCAFALLPAQKAEPLRVRGPVWAVSESLVPLEQVYGVLRKHYGGNPLDAQLLRQGGSVVLYEIQWLTDDGRKLVFTVNARDGAIVATRGAH